MDKNNYIPTDKDEVGFKPVQEPKINFYYHLSWAYKGARFCLTEIHSDNIHGTVWTGKTKDKYFTIKLEDLRHIRFRNDKF